MPSCKQNRKNHLFLGAFSCAKTILRFRVLMNHTNFYWQVSVVGIPSNLITYKFQNVPVWKNFSTFNSVP